MHDIITIGSATHDVFLQSRAFHTHPAKDAVNHVEAALPFGAKINVDAIHFDTGGGATNNAVTFARLGKFKTAALTCIGNDGEGHDIREALAREKVDTSLMQTTNKDATGYSTILYHGESAAERTILVYRGASEHFDHAQIPWNTLRAKWFYISSLGGDMTLLTKIMTHAKKIGAQVVWNPGGQELFKFSPPLRPSPSPLPAGEGGRKPGEGGSNGLLGQIAFLILNREEAAQLTGVKFDDTHGLLRALARLTKNAVMTDGPKGAYAILHENKKIPMYLHSYIPNHISAYYIPSAGSQPKNLTGAGDAFGSGFLTGWIKSGGDIKHALRLGSLNADSVVQHIGAKIGIIKTYPSKKQISALPIKTIKL